MLSVVNKTKPSQFITYKDIRDIDLLNHFAKQYGVKKRVIQVLVEMCHQWGAPKTQEVLEIGQSLSYRQVRYIYRCVQLHNDLLLTLKPGALISEEGIISRLEGRGWTELLKVENGQKRIQGTYRELVFRRA